MTIAMPFVPQQFALAESAGEAFAARAATR